MSAEDGEKSSLPAEGWSRRKIQYTEEGRQFYKEAKHRICEMLFRKADRQLESIEPLIIIVENVHTIQYSVEMLDETIAEL